MNDYLIKAIDASKNLRLLVINGKDLVAEAQQRQ